MQMIQVHPLRSTLNENSKSKFVCICALYNKFMGGMDLLDYLIALYNTKNRSNARYHRFIFYFNNLIIVQEWLLYRRDSRGTGYSICQRADGAI